MLRYCDIAEDFDADGSLRDVFAFQVSADDWRRVREGLAQTASVVVSSPDPVGLISIADCQPTEASVFALQQGADQMEGAIDPANVTPATYSAVSSCLSTLARLLDRNVIITHGGGPVHGIVAYTPGGGAVRLRRPPRSTAFSDDVRTQVMPVLRHLRSELTERPTSDLREGGSEGFCRWIVAYTPNDLRWHLELTAGEFGALWAAALGLIRVYRDDPTLWQESTGATIKDLVVEAQRLINEAIRRFEV